MDKRERINKIRFLYYSKPEVQKILLEFGTQREVVPRYFESFGKRPDTLQYSSDISGLVKKGATSFHASEEIWRNPLEINSDWTQKEMNDARKGWDLLIDIDSSFIDLSKVLAILIVEAIENHGIKKYGIKFSGSKGFHIIVSGKAFPDKFEDMNKNESFPYWPRAICEYLMSYVRIDYNKKAREIMGDIETVKKRTNLKEDEFMETNCPRCGRKSVKGKIISLRCPVCKFSIQRKNMKLTRRKLLCPQDNCAGILELEDEKDFFQCGYCEGVSSIDKRETSGRYTATFTKHADKSEKFDEEFSGEKFGASDLVLVSPRHLIRMPYSLHEKTALSSIVLSKNEVENFNPIRDANPMNVEVRSFMPDNSANEGEVLLKKAIEWKSKKRKKQEKNIRNIRNMMMILIFQTYRKKIFQDRLKNYLKV